MRFIDASSRVSVSYVASTTSAAASRRISSSVAPPGCTSPFLSQPSYTTTLSLSAGARSSSSRAHCLRIADVQQMSVAPHGCGDLLFAESRAAGVQSRAGRRRATTSAAHITVLPTPCWSARMPPPAGDASQSSRNLRPCFWKP